MARHRPAHLTHELGSGVLPGEDLVEVLEVVLGEDLREHGGGGADVHDPVGLVHESIRLELRIHRVRRPVHLTEKDRGRTARARVWS